MDSRISNLEWARHILEAINYIEEFSKDIYFEEFKENVLVRSAIERQLMIVGKASVLINEEIKVNILKFLGIKLKDFAILLFMSILEFRIKWNGR